MTKAQLELRSKFPGMGVNIFTAMNQVAKEFNAINLAQGFPNFDCPSALRELLTEAVHSQKNQYAPMPGIPELRQAISTKIKTLHGYEFDPELEITVTPGGHSALMSAASAVLHPGDEVIIFEPNFDCFSPIVQLSGAVPVYVKLSLPDYSINWEEVKQKITPRTRLIWLNSPHNPTGATLSEADLLMLTEIVRNTQILILSDEVYEHIIFDGRQHQSICRFPELMERSFAVYSLGKVYHVTGWKIGYCVAPRRLMQEFRSVYQMIQFTVNHPAQWALAQFMKESEHYLNLSKFYQKKRDFFLSKLRSSRFDFTPAQGSYFQCLGYKRITQESEMLAARRFARDAKVASIPVSSFYHDGTDNRVLRFCFAKTEDILEQAAEALSSI
jgi:methionine aminotransferase